MELKESIDVEDVKKVLRDSLALDEYFEINPHSKILSLKVEPIDILDINFRLDINFSDYTSEERLNEKGKRFLYRIGELNRRKKNFNKAIHFFELGNSNTINDYMGKLVAQDFVDIKNHQINN